MVFQVLITGGVAQDFLLFFIAHLEKACKVGFGVFHRWCLLLGGGMTPKSSTNNSISYDGLPRMPVESESIPELLKMIKNVLIILMVSSILGRKGESKSS